MFKDKDSIIPLQEVTNVENEGVLPYMSFLFIGATGNRAGQSLITWAIHSPKTSGERSQGGVHKAFWNLSYPVPDISLITELGANFVLVDRYMKSSALIYSINQFSLQR